MFPLLPVLSLFLLASSPLVGADYDGDEPPLFRFQLTERPEGMFLPGDKVHLAFLPNTDSPPPTDSFTLTVTLPAGLLPADNFWQQQGATATRRLPPPTGPTLFPTAFTARIAPGFTGRQLRITGSLSYAPDQQQSVVISVGEVLSSRLDTCMILRDTTPSGVNTIVTTRRRVSAKLRGPIDLSPDRPLFISHKWCRPADLRSAGKKKNKEEKCTALHFAFGGKGGMDYPKRPSPDSNRLSKRLKDTLNFLSNIRKGDTLDFRLKTIDGSPLGSIVQTDRSGEMTDAVTEATEYQFTAVADTAFFNQTLHLRARRRFFGLLPARQYVLVDLERRPAARTFFRDTGPALRQPGGDSILLSAEKITHPDNSVSWKRFFVQKTDNRTVFYRVEIDTGANQQEIRREVVSRDTCSGRYNVAFTVGASLRKSIRVPVDTLLYQATDEAVTIVGLRNPLGRQSAQLEVIIPLQISAGDPEAKTSLIAVAYWIGLGNQPITAYDALAEEVPPAWGQPGVSPPLAAYGNGHPIILPGLEAVDTIVQKRWLRYEFADRRSQTVFTRNQRFTPAIVRDPNHPNYGLLRGAELQQLRAGRQVGEGSEAHLRFHLSGAARHAINSYKMRLHVVAYYQVTMPKEIWLTPSSE